MDFTDQLIFKEAKIYQG